MNRIVFLIACTMLFAAVIYLANKSDDTVIQPNPDLQSASQADAINQPTLSLTMDNQTNPPTDQPQQEYNQLTPEEARVILDKGTQWRNTGEYTENKLDGLYVCRQCNERLYRSDDKFETDCGWPSFDDEIEGGVKKLRDADGLRIEILCNNCDGHLGHVFVGEWQTAKNVRHCVNSISMKFYPEGRPIPDVIRKTTLSEPSDD